MTEVLLDLNGPADPLAKAPAPDHGEALFRAMQQVAVGFSLDAVLSAAGNILVNAMRQKFATSREAANGFDEQAHRMKTSLLEHHYTTLGTRRQGSFPFNQTVSVPKLVL